MKVFDRGPTITCPKCGQRARVRKIAESESRWRYYQQLVGFSGEGFIYRSVNHDYLGGWRGAGMLCSVCGRDVPSSPAFEPRSDAEILQMLADSLDDQGRLEA